MMNSNNNNNNNLLLPPLPPFFPPNFGPDQFLQPPLSLTNFLRQTTLSNRVFPSQPPPITNGQIDFSANTPAILESSQINDFLTLLPEILKFELRNISKPKTHLTMQTLSGNRLIGEIKRVIEKEKPKEEI